MKKSILSVLAFSLLSIFVSGCASMSEPVPPTPTLMPTSPPPPTETPIIYEVEIDVVDGEGNPIPEAKII